MCVIAVALKKDPSMADLYKCESSNPHGGGVAWAENGYVHFKKGIRAEEMQDLVANKPFPHVFHFRIASVGKVIPALCHPFTIKRKHNCDMAGVTNSPILFHNGTIPEWKFMAQLAGVKYPDFASDSMVLARIISLRGEGVLSHLTSGNKFVILWPNGDVKTYGGFTRIDGNDYSNSYWNWRGNYYSPDTTCSTHRDKHPYAGSKSQYQCPECQGWNVDSDNSGQFLCNDCYHLWVEKAAGEEKVEGVPTVADVPAVGVAPEGSVPPIIVPVSEAQMPSNYRMVKPDEVVQKGDEYNYQGKWSPVISSIGTVAGISSHFRRMIVSANTDHRMLDPDETVQAGDEICLGTSMEWHPAGDGFIGKPSGTILKFRRILALTNGGAKP